MHPGKEATDDVSSSASSGEDGYGVFLMPQWESASITQVLEVSLPAAGLSVLGSADHKVGLVTSGCPTRTS